MTSRPIRADIAPRAPTRPASWTTPSKPPGDATLGTPALTGLGHELRGPLTGIVGLTRLLLTKLNAGPVDTGSLVRHLELIENSARQSLATIERVITAVKIDTGETRCDARTGDARRTVTEVANGLRAMATDRGLPLRVDLPEHATPLTTDHELLGQLLRELIINAVKFTDSGGIRVRLRAGTGEPVAIDVTDDGPGIPAADQDRVFAPFTRGPRPPRAGDEGAGLGLYLARTVADLLGVRLSVHSQIGTGSTFTITFSAPVAASGPGLQPRS